MSQNEQFALQQCLASIIETPARCIWRKQPVYTFSLSVLELGKDDAETEDGILMWHRVDARGYHVNGGAADAKCGVHVGLECPPSNDCTKRIEQTPRVCNIQSHQHMGGLKIMVDNTVIEHGQMKWIILIIVLAEHLALIQGSCKFGGFTKGIVS